MQFLLFYEFAPDGAERRAPHRQAHLRAAWAAQSRGELVLGGAYADPVDGAVLLFQCDSPDVVVSRDNQGGKRDNQDGKFFDWVIFEAFGSDLTRLEAI